MNPEARSDSLGEISPRIVVFPGEVDIHNAARLGAILRRAMRHGAAVVIADLTLTDFMDSAGLRSLILAWKEAQRRGVEFRVVVPSPQVLRILQVTGVDKVLTVLPDTGAALAGFDSPTELPIAAVPRARALRFIPRLQPRAWPAVRRRSARSGSP
jgi:anti-anti-sigma factor